MADKLKIAITAGQSIMGQKGVVSGCFGSTHCCRSIKMSAHSQCLPAELFGTPQRFLGVFAGTPNWCHFAVG